MDIEVRLLGSADAQVLARVAPDVFDERLDRELLAEFLNDPRHHLVVALDGGDVVGFASAVDYVHPDKPKELWINEVGVAPTHQGRGIGKELLRVLFQHARTVGCKEAWVLTDHTNDRARRLYTAVGGSATEQLMFTFQL